MKLPHLHRFPSRSKWITALTVLFAGGWTSVGQAGDLLVGFEQVGSDVRVTVNSWQVPEALTVYENGAATPTTRVGYEVVNDDGILVRNAVEDEEYWAVILLGPDAVSLGTIDFSNLNSVNIVASGVGELGGIRLIRDHEEEVDTGVFAFKSYEEGLRLAVFNVVLVLPDTSLEDLFVNAALLSGGGFSVWSSEDFDVKFVAVPEPGTAGLVMGAGMLFLVLAKGRRRQAWIN